MRLILADDNSEVYLEALKIVKYVTSALAPHLGALDLHILIGSFIGIIVSNTVSSNLRIQVASDKVIILFAKHNNIGPLVVAKDIIKNVEKIVQAVQKSGNKKKDILLEKKSFLLRFLSILLLLVNQFSIVLCYQADFNDKMIVCLGQLIECSDSDQSIKNLLSQIFSVLYSIDSQTIETSISKLDGNKKNPLLKLKAEIDGQLKNGKTIMTDSKSPYENSDLASRMTPFRMSPSIVKNSSTSNLVSSGQPQILRSNKGDEKDEQYRNSDGFKSELRGNRRLQQKISSGMNYNLDGQTNTLLKRVSINESPISSEGKYKPELIRRSQNSGLSKFTLPEIAPKSNNVLPAIAGASLGLMGSYEPTIIAPAKPAGRRIGQSQREYPTVDSMNRPPLYKKAGVTVRDGNNFNDDQIAPSGRFRVTSQTQSDFNNAKREMNSSTGMGSNLNTLITGASIPQATFEISTTKYGVDNRPRKRDLLDEELNKYNLR